MAHPFLTIRTPPQLKAALMARAEKEGRSTSALAVRVLEAAVRRWDGAKPAPTKGAR
jgi:plasmid stability protein